MTTLQILRDRTGRLQADIAAEVGISREYLSALEHEKRPLSRDMAEKLAKVYDISPAELMGYHIPDSERSLKNERDHIRLQLDRINEEHARELQAKQSEIDYLKEQNAQLRHDLEYMQSLCKMALNKSNSLPGAESDTEIR
jgi:transcriptional regulator with XRE-family HTH domain